MTLISLFSLTAGAGNSLILMSGKVFSVKHDDDIDPSQLSSNQLIDLLKSNEVHVLDYTPMGNFIKKNRIKIGTWTEAGSVVQGRGISTAKIIKAIKSAKASESDQNSGE